ncbi:ring-cleaving dioxygenase [Salinicoccus cyprini]|uniref:Ring-cleaving dioxygenase n=1 Tax=Salinicoccus cyprini TaxID=2493691 RepID=A0A558ASW5_9STAP|nr:VOC family protein [Salinicoccus cyprini]TVT27286.1 ring-cleaving dioxygenase [Salinicoccus cyprini]
MTVKGIHHVSSITREILDNHEFYTDILGLRLVKKTVNQDDTSMYHLFYADYMGTPGADITFFEIVNAPQYQSGTNSISRTYFRVPTREALEFFKERFADEGVYHEGIIEQFGRTIMKFEDNERQRLALIVEQSDEHTTPNDHPEIPNEYAITSIGAVEVTVQYIKPMVQFLELLGGRVEGEFDDDATEAVVNVGNGSVYVIEQRNSQIEKEGYGSVHHFSLRVDDEDALLEMKQKVDQENWRNSGIVDRHYFKALYITTVGNITVEISTDGPGFDVDEPVESLGENLSLPPKFEEQRDFIETYLIPIR